MAVTLADLDSIPFIDTPSSVPPVTSSQYASADNITNACSRVGLPCIMIPGFRQPYLPGTPGQLLIDVCTIISQRRRLHVAFLILLQFLTSKPRLRIT